MNDNKSYRYKDKNSQNKDPDSHFTCIFCGRSVSKVSVGTRHRNHCPWCLRSIHLDEHPGDRRSSCNGIMEPIAISVRKGEWILIHRCNDCGTLKANRIAGDDNEMALLSLAVRPVAQPPFPLDGLFPNISSEPE
ncbi:MAG: RNHCP domain-containing protein [Dehalococcoidales bacterium]|nr:RNHCP domain-containing protein [Dehalococcoidales bacterium]